MAPVSLSSALAQDTHRVRVITSGTPQAISARLVGDALNPSTWQIERVDTGQILALLTVLQVTTTSYDLVLLDALGPLLATHELSSTTLKSSTGEIIVAPTSVDFAGLAESASIAIKPAGGSVDLLNQPTPTSDRLGGTLQIVSGDYVTQSGVDLYRKLVIRRLTTKPGAFFHLPNYGLGLSLKEPVPMGTAARLKAEIERQVKLEPETIEVNATVIISPSGIETVIVKSKIKGEPNPVITMLAEPISL